MKNTIFKNSAQFAHMRMQWKHSCHSSDRFSTLEPTTEYLTDKNGREYVSPEKTGMIRIPGSMSASHHVLYNLLRGKALDSGFTTPTSNHITKQHTFIIAYRHLKYYQSLVIHADNKDTNSENRARYHKVVTKYLRCFNGAVTLDMFRSITLPHDPLHAHINIEVSPPINTFWRTAFDKCRMAYKNLYAMT